MNCPQCGRAVADGSVRCNTCFAEIKAPLAGPAVAPAVAAPPPYQPVQGPYAQPYGVAPHGRAPYPAYGRSSSNSSTGLVIGIITVAAVGIFAIGMVVRLLVLRPAVMATTTTNAPFVSLPPGGFVPAPSSRNPGFAGGPVIQSPTGPRLGPGNSAFQAQQDAMNRMNQQMEQQRQWANQMHQQNLDRMQQMQQQSQQNMEAMRQRSMQNMQNMQDHAQQMQGRNEENLQNMNESQQNSMGRIRGMMRPGPGYGGLGF